MTSAGAPREVPAVTVLIAAYNAESFLHRAVASALQQTLPVKEVLIVDDASTDGTAALARKLAQGDERIRLITLAANGGPSAARNAGLDAATGEWIAVLDADDAFTPERLEGMLTYALDVRADIVVDSFCYYNSVRKTAGRSVLDESVPSSLVDFAEFLSKARPYESEPDWGLLKPIFRREFLGKHGLRYPLKTRHGEDFLLMCEAFLHGAKYVLYRRAGYLYTAGDTTRTIRDYRLMYRHTRQLLQDGRISRDPLLVRRLQERAAAVKQLSAEYDFARLRSEHDYNSIAMRALSDNTFRRVVAKRLVRKLLARPG